MPGKRLPSLPPGEVGFRALLRRYKTNAKKRNYGWSITSAQFRELTSSPCHYCGSPPGQAYEIASSGLKEETRKRSQYFYNGLDRADNTRGYEIDNLVPACGKCNRAKYTMTQAEFYDWLKILREHQELLGKPRTTAEILDLAKGMKDLGVIAFKLDGGGLSVNFEPPGFQSAFSKPPSPIATEADFAALERQNAMERMRFNAEEDGDDVLYDAVRP